MRNRRNTVYAQFRRQNSLLTNTCITGLRDLVDN